MGEEIVKHRYVEEERQKWIIAQYGKNGVPNNTPTCAEKEEGRKNHKKCDFKKWTFYIV